MDNLLITTILGLLILVASMVSVELAISVAIIEIALGVVAGNFLGVTSTPWIDFIAAVASIVLTFLAGAEVDAKVLRERATESVLTKTELGKVIMAATFITDLATAIALSLLFIQPTPYLVLFVGVSVAVIGTMALLQRWFFDRYGDRVIEPEIKGVLFVLFLLMWTADLAKSHAVLPAFVLGFAVSGAFRRHPEQLKRFRIVAFSLLTPFFFFKGGLNVSLDALAGALPLLAGFLLVKIALKFAGVMPVALRYLRPHATFTTLLMSTGLTFGTISSLYGLNAGIIDRTQFSVLVAAVIVSAVVPTAIAQRRFSPPVHPLTEREIGAIEDEEIEPARA